MAVVVDRIAGGGGVSIPVSLTTSTGATTTEGILLGTTETATVGAQKWSPSLHFQGSGWKTAATAGAQSCDWQAEVQPVQGTAAPTNQLVFSQSINGAAFASQIYFDTGKIGCSAATTFIVSSAVSQNLSLSPGSGGNVVIGTTAQFTGGAIWARTGSFGIFAASASVVGWGSSSDNTGTNDTGLSRISAGVVGVGTGAAGSVAGVISATSHMRVPLTVATLPAGATRGYTCIVTDASNPTFLATVVGGASTVAPVFYDGAAWKVG